METLIAFAIRNNVFNNLTILSIIGSIFNIAATIFCICLILDNKS